MSGSSILNLFQILLSLMVITAVILQAKGAGLGNIFGGAGGDTYRTRRGLEKTLFRGTIVLMLVFVGAVDRRRAALIDEAIFQPICHPIRQRNLGA